jgi:2-keto-3-deoxy-L-rhamnonate aldolase RhmA
MESSGLQLFYFSSEAGQAKRAEDAGVDSIIVDWENQGKYARQQNYDTQINRHTVEDLDRVFNAVKVPITVRVNGGAAALEEADLAIDHGARVIMLPMANSGFEVEALLQRINGRAKTLIQIETQAMVERVGDLQSLGWDYAFVGFNDLMISRGRNWLWEPMVDGTMDTIFRRLPGRQIGFGGVTIIGGGYPLPFVNLLQEFARLGASLSFLRRTFSREAAGRDLPSEISAVQAVWRAARRRSDAAVREDYLEFCECLQRIRPADSPREVMPVRLAS